LVEIVPGTDGLLHVPDNSESRVRHVRDELTGGDPILVTALAVEGGGMRLLRRALMREQVAGTMREVERRHCRLVR
jgi:polyribonucleotide nucleotidyltransferase